ncbi:RagB/SusD family nutrient uptake outer membrane protein [Sphingobacterium suaedae]|uniref:RagB/SusD family nutrient uptake outer membrane protein n=1 Tax=Sphingobacterium suaedae TaxID=1686402 RepID=A0ABW5KF95_9SPHI
MKHSILYISIVLFFTACNTDFLDTDPATEFSETAVWSDPALVETFINQIYFRLDEPLTDGRMKANLVDEGHYRGNASSLNFNRSRMTPDDLLGWGVSRFRKWEDLYKSIRYCNLFFAKAEEVPFGTQPVDGKTEKERMTGEVHFLRAFLYQSLVSTYGGVPLISEVYNLDDGFQKERSSFAECIQFIVADLDKAAELLPVAHSGANIGRATKGAALALKSRVLLYAASDLYNTHHFDSFEQPDLLQYTTGTRAERWVAAKNAAKAVIDLGIYQLYRATPAPTDDIAQNYADIFLNKTTEEDIFIKFFTTPMGQRFGLYTSPNGYHGWGTNAPLGDFVDDFEMRDGSRFNWSNPVHAAAPYQNRDPRFYGTVLFNEASWRQRPDDAKGIDPHNKIQTGRWERWNASSNSMTVSYGVDTRKSSIEDWNGSYTGYYLRKYVDPMIDAQYIRQAVTWRYIRYAEILLNYAEACIALGEDQEAKLYINQVRKRAGMPAVTETGTALRDRYRNERRIELGFEEHRFYDVRRWMIAPQVYNRTTKVADIVYKMNPDHSTSVTPTVKHVDFEQYTWDDKAYFLPILRDEMNKNEKLIQNPNY